MKQRSRSPAPPPPPESPPPPAWEVAPGAPPRVCTADGSRCRALPVAVGHQLVVSPDGTLVARDARHYRAGQPRSTSPGLLEIWDTVRGRRVARTAFRYGADAMGDDIPPGGTLEFFDDETLIAYTMPCAQPCSVGNLYATSGAYLETLAMDPTASTWQHFHDRVYVLTSLGRPLPIVAQDLATMTTTTLDDESNAAAAVAGDRIIRVVGSPRPRVDFWDRDVKRTGEIAIPLCR